MDISELAAYLIVLGYLGYRAHLYFFRPELIAQERQQQHERQMKKDAARIEARAKVASGLLPTVLGIIIRLLFKR
jgi:hypothetical protein